MKAFTLLVAVVGLCSARPEPPVGYNYPQPSGSYGAPHGGSLGGGIISAGGYIGGGSIGGGHIGGGSIEGGHIGGGSIRGGHIGGGSIGGGSIGGGSFSGSFGGGHTGGGSIGGGVSDGGFGGGFGGGYASGFGGGYQSAIIQKHIYVHVPPPEPIEHRPQHVPQVAPPQKHYKIIFIKAPTPPTPTAPIIPLQQQNEEKTLVYVLVKKPEEQPDIIIPTPAPTQPSKPEVYFIKYSSQKQAIGGGSIGGGLGGGLGGGIGGGSIGGGIGGGLGDAGLGDGGHIGGSGIGGTGIGGTGIGGGSGLDVSTNGGQYGPPGHVPGSPIH